MNGKLPVFNIERFAIHDGEGIRTAVFLQGCPLHCPWCANPESRHIGPQLMFSEEKCAGCGTCIPVCPKKAIALKDGKACVDRTACAGCGACEQACPNTAMRISGKWMTAGEIFAIVIRDADYYRKTHGGLTLSGGEALLHIDELEPLLEACQAHQIPVNFETCGHVPVGNTEKAIRWTQRFLFDVKTADPVKFRQLTGGDLDLVLENLEAIARDHPEKIIIRTPVIPTFNHAEEDIRAIMDTALRMGVSRMDLLPYHTLGMIKYTQLGTDYPFPEKRGLTAAELQPYADMGRKRGLTVSIGG